MQWTGTVSTRGDRLNVRETPAGRVVGQIENGAAVQVLGDAGEWLAVAYGEGQGFVAKQYVALDASAPRMRIVDSQGNAFEPVGGFTVSVVGND